MTINKFWIFGIGVFVLVSCARPMADFSINQKSKKAPAEVHFENKSKKANSYLWDFGDGQTSQEPSPDHRYVLSGNYTVTLKAKKGNKESMKEKEILIEAPHDCLIEMKTTMGDMIIQLYDDTPKHRDNFIKLAEEGFYDGTLFHRVIDGFMIQGGDPDSKGASPSKRLGMGGPGYTIPEEINEEYVHIKGALCAARQGDAVNPKKNSSGSQFYIAQGKKLTDDELDSMERRKGMKYTKEQRRAYKTLGGIPFLDMEYTVYGKVIKGLDVIDKIAKVKTAPGDRPVEDVKIVSVRVIR